jgi:hypothetical protein
MLAAEMKPSQEFAKEIQIAAQRSFHSPGGVMSDGQHRGKKREKGQERRRNEHMGNMKEASITRKETAGSGVGT